MLERDIPYPRALLSLLVPYVAFHVMPMTSRSDVRRQTLETITTSMIVSFTKPKETGDVRMYIYNGGYGVRW